MDGNQIAATWDDFGCLEVSPAGFGDTLWKAIGNLIDNTPAKQINGIVSSIENAAVEERASKSVESPGTVPAVAAANSAMLEIADIIGTFVSWSAPTLGSAASEALYKRIDAVVAQLQQ